MTETNFFPAVESKGDMLNAWLEKADEEKLSSQAVAGQLIAGGAAVKNYSDAKLWEPHVFERDGRKLLTFTEFFGVGTKLGVETLEVGLKYTFVTQGSKSHKTPAIAMVPYLRLNSAGDIDSASSYLLMMTEAQKQAVAAAIAKSTSG